MIAAHLLAKSAQAPEALLKLIAFVNTLFFASFLSVLLISSPAAKAADIVCTGRNLLETMEPAIRATIDNEAAKTINGTARLWKIEKSGTKPSYLFGTMHISDPRVVNLTPEAQMAFDASDTIVIETTEVLDQTKAATALLARPDLMMFTDTTTLTSLVDPKDLPALEKGLAARGMPLAAMNKMKPWMISGVLAVPACETARIKAGAQILDIKLGKDAEMSAKKIAGLETIIEQFEAMASLPMKSHIEGLVEAASMGDMTTNVMETMIVLYTKGQIGSIMPFVKHVAPSGAESLESSGEFEEIMINARNTTMATRAEALLAKGNAFIAVGAMHLPGEKGLVEKFRNVGYTVTPAAK